MLPLVTENDLRIILVRHMNRGEDEAGTVRVRIILLERLVLQTCMHIDLGSIHLTIMGNVK